MWRTQRRQIEGHVSVHCNYDSLLWHCLKACGHACFSAFVGKLCNPHSSLRVSLQEFGEDTEPLAPSSPHWLLPQWFLMNKGAGRSSGDIRVQGNQTDSNSGPDFGMWKLSSFSAEETPSTHSTGLSVKGERVLHLRPPHPHMLHTAHSAHALGHL